MLLHFGHPHLTNTDITRVEMLPSLPLLHPARNLTGLLRISEEPVSHLQTTPHLHQTMDIKRYPFTDFVTVTQVKPRKSKSGKELDTYRSGRLWVPTGARGVFGGQV